MDQQIDRHSPTPYYEQLFVILQSHIKAGALAAGDRLPSEDTLGREFGLSRATVRQTLQKLEREGWAQRIPHRGVFVSSPEPPSGWVVEEGFLESQIRHGRTGITTRVIDAAYAAVSGHVASSLRVDEGSEVFALERLRSLDGRPAMFSTNWLPEEIGRVIAGLPGVLDGSDSLDAALRAAGYVASGAHRRLHATRAPEVVAAHLGVGTDDPVLRVRSVTWDQRGIRFDYYETWVLTELIPLEVNVAAA